MLQHFRLSENVGDGKERVAWDLFTESYDLVGLLGQSLQDKLYFNKEGIQGADPGSDPGRGWFLGGQDHPPPFWGTPKLLNEGKNPPPFWGTPKLLNEGKNPPPFWGTPKLLNEGKNPPPFWGTPKLLNEGKNVALVLSYAGCKQLPGPALFKSFIHPGLCPLYQILDLPFPQCMVLTT